MRATPRPRRGHDEGHMSTLSLFDLDEPVSDFSNAQSTQKPDLAQWFTPDWGAQAIVDRYFPDLSASDLTVEPSCGPGAFLKAIPDDVPVIGVEIDPELAELARQNTGRQVLTGDFATVPLPDGVTTIIGNPPFALPIVESFLARAGRILPKEGRCGLLLPAYNFQTFGRVNRWNDLWSLRVEMIPRGLFHGLQLPLVFCVFRKDSRREMVGMALYAEAGAIANMTKQAQALLKNGSPRTNVWRSFVREALQRLGGRASLAEIYNWAEPQRPTGTAFWREKIRQQLQLNFTRCGEGIWALDPAV